MASSLVSNSDTIENYTAGSLDNDSFSDGNFELFDEQEQQDNGLHSEKEEWENEDKE